MNYVKIIKKQILPILRKNKIKKAGLFGSCARGEAKKGSDVDLLVSLPKGASLLDFIGIKQELEDVLGTEVDLVEYRAIKKSLRQKILSEQVSVL